MAFGSLFQSAGHCVTECVLICKDITLSAQNRRQFLIKLGGLHLLKNVIAGMK